MCMESRRGAHPEVLQGRVEPLAILAQALLAVVNVAVDLDDLRLELCVVLRHGCLLRSHPACLPELRGLRLYILLNLVLQL